MEVEEEVQPSSEYETVSSETKRPYLTQMRVYSPRIHRDTEARCNVKQSFVKLLKLKADKGLDGDDCLSLLVDREAANGAKIKQSHNCKDLGSTEHAKQPQRSL